MILTPFRNKMPENDGLVGFDMMVSIVTMMTALFLHSIADTVPEQAS